MKIALAGNPNSGKTTIFNALTGKVERVGNWSGVTVEKKIAKLRRKYNKTYEEILVVDLPGAYGLDAYTNDEHVATDFIKKEKLDLIINVVDASNLERSLFFTTQLIEIGIPVVVALNKADIVKSKKNNIDTELLEELLDSPVIWTKATSKKGLKELMEVAIEVVKENY